MWELRTSRLQRIPPKVGEAFYEQDKEDNVDDAECESKQDMGDVSHGKVVERDARVCCLVERTNHDQISISMELAEVDEEVGDSDYEKECSDQGDVCCRVGEFDSEPTKGVLMKEREYDTQGSIVDPCCEEDPLVVLLSARAHLFPPWSPLFEDACSCCILP